MARAFQNKTTIIKSIILYFDWFCIECGHGSAALPRSLLDSIIYSCIQRCLLDLWLDFSISHLDFAEAFVRIPGVLHCWCWKEALRLVSWFIGEFLRVQRWFNESRTRTRSTNTFNIFPNRRLPFQLLPSVSLFAEALSVFSSMERVRLAS